MSADADGYWTHDYHDLVSRGELRELDPEALAQCTGCGIWKKTLDAALHYHGRKAYMAGGHHVWRLTEDSEWFEYDKSDKDYYHRYPHIDECNVLRKEKWKTTVKCHYFYRCGNDVYETLEYKKDYYDFGQHYCKKGFGCNK